LSNLFLKLSQDLSLGSVNENVLQVNTKVLATLTSVRKKLSSQCPKVTKMPFHKCAIKRFMLTLRYRIFK